MPELPQALLASDDVLEAWLRAQSARRGGAVAVRVAVAAAKTALGVWERAGFATPAPHQRLAAAEAWLAEPTPARADAAAQLAFANGDDNPLKGLRGVWVDGRSAGIAQCYAHWSADYAACIASLVQRDLEPANAVVPAVFMALAARTEAGEDGDAARRELVVAIVSAAPEWSLEVPARPRPAPPAPRPASPAPPPTPPRPTPAPVAKPINRETVAELAQAVVSTFHPMERLGEKVLEHLEVEEIGHRLYRWHVEWRSEHVRVAWRWQREHVMGFDEDERVEVEVDGSRACLVDGAFLEPPSGVHALRLRSLIEAWLGRSVAPSR